MHSDVAQLWFDFKNVLKTYVDGCYSQIAGQYARERYGEQINNVENAPTFYRQ